KLVAKTRPESGTQEKKPTPQVRLAGVPSKKGPHWQEEELDETSHFLEGFTLGLNAEEEEEEDGEYDSVYEEEDVDNARDVEQELYGSGSDIDMDALHADIQSLKGHADNLILSIQDAKEKEKQILPTKQSHILTIQEVQVPPKGIPTGKRKMKKLVAAKIQPLTLEEGMQPNQDMNDC
ncbi:hypothetical protein FRC17_008633, partial [Serendipita sp. 399]